MCVFLLDYRYPDLIFIRKTYACLDVAALAGNNSSPGLYSCGGLPGGIGNASVNQVDSRRDGVFVSIHYC